MTTGRLLAGSLWLMLCASAAVPPAAAQQATASYRVFDSGSAEEVDLGTLAARLARADVAFLGEQHDDEVAHRVERALLEALAGRRDGVTLALEMFERDAQEPLDRFQMGRGDEADFLERARPWPTYARDYKALVDFAIAHRWPVVAANAPRPLAAEVASAGLAVLTNRSEADRRLVAADLQCTPAGDYFERFVRALGTHGQTLAEEARVRYYEAQCLKDETMAESIAQAHVAGATGGRRPLVLSVNGVVHSDFRLGTVERVLRRLPDRDVVTVTVVPVASLTDGPGAAIRERADYVVLTLKPSEPTSPSDDHPRADGSSSAP